MEILWRLSQYLIQQREEHEEQSDGLLWDFLFRIFFDIFSNLYYESPPILEFGIVLLSVLGDSVKNLKKAIEW